MENGVRRPGAGTCYIPAENGDLAWKQGDVGKEKRSKGTIHTMCQAFPRQTSPSQAGDDDDLHLVEVPGLQFNPVLGRTSTQDNAAMP